MTVLLPYWSLNVTLPQVIGFELMSVTVAVKVTD